MLNHMMNYEICKTLKKFLFNFLLVNIYVNVWNLWKHLDLMRTSCDMSAKFHGTVKRNENLIFKVFDIIYECVGEWCNMMVIHRK
jgi:hypothetical protein